MIPLGGRILRAITKGHPEPGIHAVFQPVPPALAAVWLPLHLVLVTGLALASAIRPALPGGSGAWVLCHVRRRRLRLNPPGLAPGLPGQMLRLHPT